MRCPVHEGEGLSLHAWDGGDAVGLKCFARDCSYSEILTEAGFPPGDRSGEVRPKSHAPSKLRSGAGEWSDSSRPAGDLAHPKLGRPDQSWEIRDEHGRLFGLHSRWNFPDGKEIRWWRHGEWSLDGLKTAQSPLYGSEKIASFDSSRPVVVVEGERATDALEQIGVQALGTVTGAGGTPSHESLNVLAGRSVILWPDADEPGQQHMERVAVALAGACPELRLFAPPGLPPGGDAVEWLESHGNESPERLREILEGGGEPVDPPTEAQDLEASQLSQSRPAFPVDVLPVGVRRFVLEISGALVVDPAIVAGPCLAVLAGCIGNRRRIVVNPGAWTEPAVLWIALVLRSGARKTPALHAVVEHLQEIEAAEIEAEKARQEEHDEAEKRWKAMARGERGEPPEKPQPARRFLVSDVTTEGLLSVHTRAPMGLLLHRDELGGWLRSFNQYKAGGRGSDAQTWCELHQGHPALIDRKGSGTLSVPRAAVSIVGGIQPKLLRQVLSGEHLFDGVASRVLFVVPPEKRKTWTDVTVSEEVREGWRNLLEELLALECDQDGDPLDLPMTCEAKLAWIAYYEEHAKREEQADGPFRSALSKLEAATARLALVIQLAEDPESTEVDADAMEAGIAISEWFEGQALKVYRGIEKGAVKRDRRDICRWISDRGGSTTRREFARYGPNRFRSRAKEVLEDLVSTEWLERKPQSGNKADRYHLCDPDTSGGNP